MLDFLEEKVSDDLKTICAKVAPKLDFYTYCQGTWVQSLTGLTFTEQTGWALKVKVIGALNYSI